ncbi:MAG: methyltransferase [Catenulispora sp.]|nr:methyltransferase [Catenulispora sp.]
MKRLLLDFLWTHLDELGAFREPGQLPETAREAAGLAPGYQAWFDECLRVFVAEGYVQRRDGRIHAGEAVRHRPVEELWREWEAEKAGWRDNPDLAPTYRLVETTLRVLPEILTGRRAATEVMFPGGSVQLVEDAYKTNPASAFFNRVLADDLVARLGDQPRILEVGAGTGATSAVVLEALRSARVAVGEYCYTDVSRAFLQHAQRSFGPANPFLAYGILDIERPIADQGFDVGGYDVVLAANVLHATRDIRVTVRNAKAALKPGGVLVLNELTANNLLSQFSFGLLDGWWRYEDAELRIPGSPLLSTAGWRRVLAEAGFRAVTLPAGDAEDLGQQIIVAESDGVIRQVRSRPLDVAPEAALEARPAPVSVPASPQAPVSAEREPGDPVRAHVEDVVLDVLAEALEIPRSRIARDQPFSDYGLDSIFAVNVARTAGARLGIDLDITVLFEYGTLQDLSGFIVTEYADDLHVTPALEPNGPDPEPTALDGSIGAEAMAIIGMSARFPQADDPEQFWRLVEQGRRCLTPPPAQRPDWARHGAGAADVRGGFLDGVFDFDPLFFRMSMTEARAVSPELRLMLMTAWNAVEDAGYRPADLRTRPTGVFIATTQSEYRLAKSGTGSDLMSLPSTAMVPNRISYLLDLAGPSEQYDTACSSSFVALHRAIRSIRAGECEQALVGGVNLLLSPAGFSGMRAAGMLSPRGEVRPFQQEADGTARGEGVAAILIKPLSRAVADGDFVYGVVRGTGVAHGGRGVSFTAPNIRGMKTAIAHAYADAGIEPDAMDYVETHGMSSILADSAELAALGAGLRAQDGDRGSGGDDAVTYLGNVKPVIGHTEVVSGLATLLKAVQAMQHGVIPAVPGFGSLHRDLSLDGTRMRIATENLPWPVRTDDDGRVLPRRAGLHSFGIGGVNAHVVVEGYRAEEASGDGAGPQVLVLSAQNPDALRERAQRLVGVLADADPRRWADIAYTLQVGREEMSCRLAFVASGVGEAADMLRAWLDGDGDGLVMDAVAEHWVAGDAVDWQALHQGSRRLRVPLPGYPFARQTCFAADEQPESSGEAFVGDLVATVLGLPRAEIDGTRPLADYGLNSLLMTAMLGRIRSEFPGFQPEWLQPHDTLDDVVERLSQPDVAADALSRRPRFPELVHLNTVTEGRPVFWIHGALAGVESFRSIAARVDRPFYGIQARGLLSDDPPIEGVAAMAEYYSEIIRGVQPEGPYDVGGFCLGGIVGYEVTRLLQARGEQVDSLIMVDSPDETGLAKSNANGFQSARSAALQVVNSLLWPAGEHAAEQLRARLIHQDDVADSDPGEEDDDAFVQRLAAIAAGRGLAMRPEQIVRFIQRNMAIQLAYQLGEHRIRPLPRPEAVSATYFRNSRGLFMGEVEPYFQVVGETYSLDGVDYWQDWERELPGLRMVDIEAANHMTILIDSGPLATIEQVCAATYAKRGL